MRASKSSISEQLSAFGSRVAALPGARSETRPRARSANDPSLCLGSSLCPPGTGLDLGTEAMNLLKSEFLSPLGPLGLSHAFPSRPGEGTRAVLLVPPGLCATGTALNVFLRVRGQEKTILASPGPVSEPEQLPEPRRPALCPVPCAPCPALCHCHPAPPALQHPLPLPLFFIHFLFFLHFLHTKQVRSSQEGLLEVRE